MTTLTVFFDNPWWIGVAETSDTDGLRVFRYIFGSEPGTGEIYEFVLRDLNNLWQQPLITTSEPTKEDKPTFPKINPKRANREAGRKTKESGISSKAQEAMRLQIEQNKQERKEVSRQRREEIADYKRQKAREKALAKHRGH